MAKRYRRLFVLPSVAVASDAAGLLSDDNKEGSDRGEWPAIATKNYHASFRCDNDIGSTAIDVVAS